MPIHLAALAGEDEDDAAVGSGGAADHGRVGAAGGEHVQSGEQFGAVAADDGGAVLERGAAGGQG